MVSFQAKDLKLSYANLTLSDCYLSLNAMLTVKGELFPFR